MTTLSALSDDLLTNEEAAALLGIKPNTLEIWRGKGKGLTSSRWGQPNKTRFGITSTRSRLGWLHAPSPVPAPTRRTPNKLFDGHGDENPMQPRNLPTPHTRR